MNRVNKGELPRECGIISVSPINEPVVVYTMFSEDKQRVGYCILTAAIKEAGSGVLLLNKGVKPAVKVGTVWHIWVNSKHRRKGYATHMIDAIKKHYDAVRAEGLNKKGISFFAGVGFERVDVSNSVLFTWKKAQK